MPLLMCFRRWRRMEGY